VQSPSFRPLCILVIFILLSFPSSCHLRPSALSIFMSSPSSCHPRLCVISVLPSSTSSPSPFHLHPFVFLSSLFFHPLCLRVISLFSSPIHVCPLSCLCVISVLTSFLPSCHLCPSVLSAFLSSLFFRSLRLLVISVLPSTSSSCHLRPYFLSLFLSSPSNGCFLLSSVSSCSSNQNSSKIFLL